MFEYVRCRLDTYFLTRKSSKNQRQQILSLSGLTRNSDDAEKNPRIVKLTKPSDGYGFFLKMIQNSPMHIIDQVDRMSVAEQVGLRPGDILACVNGMDVMHSTHAQCVDIIRESGNSVELTVASREVMDILYQHGVSVDPDFLDRWKYLDKEIHSYSNDAFEDTTSFDLKPSPQTGRPSLGGLADGAGSLMMNQELQRRTVKTRLVPEPLVLSSTGSVSEVVEQSPSPPRTCELELGDEGFGFHLLDKEDLIGHYISEVKKGGSADLAGLKEGDRLLQVNEFSINDKTYDEVVQLIENSGPKITFVVVDDGPQSNGMEIKSDLNQKFDRRSLSSCTSVHECRVSKRPEEAFEFFLMVDKVRNAQVIMSVTNGGPADRCGLRNGDRLIEVNGINVENKDHEEVVKLIKQSVPSNELSLLVSGEKRSLYNNPKQKGCKVS